MTDTITLTGVVATTPRLLQTPTGLSITSFRLASAQRRFDRSKSEWIDSETNWYTVNTFRQLADNAGASLGKGDRVVVAGRLRIRAWESGERSGTTVEVDADSLGHDLFWGRSTFVRSAALRATSAPDATPVEVAPGASPPAELGAGVAVAPLPGLAPGSAAESAPALAPVGASGMTPGGADVISPQPLAEHGGEPVRETVPAGSGDWHSGEDEPPF